MKIFKGVVLSSGKMKDTIKVQVSRVVKHPVYLKRYKKFKKYLVHDVSGAKTGDKVTFVAVKPISKMKKWATIVSEPKVKVSKKSK
jgi:small subunit ribosomal protein S17